MAIEPYESLELIFESSLESTDKAMCRVKMMNTYTKETARDIKVIIRPHKLKYKVRAGTFDLSYEWESDNNIASMVSITPETHKITSLAPGQHSAITFEITTVGLQEGWLVLGFRTTFHIDHASWKGRSIYVRPD